MGAFLASRSAAVHGTSSLWQALLGCYLGQVLVRNMSPHRCDPGCTCVLESYTHKTWHDQSTTTLPTIHRHLTHFVRSYHHISACCYPLVFQVHNRRWSVSLTPTPGTIPSILEGTYLHVKSWFPSLDFFPSNTMRSTNPCFMFQREIFPTVMSLLVSLT